MQRFEGLREACDELGEAERMVKHLTAIVRNDFAGIVGAPDDPGQFCRVFLKIKEPRKCPVDSRDPGC